METGTILGFLKKLKRNNKKTWFDAHRDDYAMAKMSFENFVGDLIGDMTVVDPSLASLQPKDCIFRIFRDTRFSKDKTPYKTNFGAFLASGGRKSSGAGYYIHIEPGASMLGGGLYMPPSDILLKMRNYVAEEADGLKKIIKAPVFKKYFNALQPEKLKTMPKGFPASHPHAEWLKYTSYVVLHKISDKELSNPRFEEHVIKGFKAMKPLCDFINDAVSQ